MRRGRDTRYIGPLAQSSEATVDTRRDGTADSRLPP